MADSLFSVFLLLLLTFFSGYYSATEIAFFSLSPATIKTFNQSPDPKKKLVAQLISHPRDLLVTVFMLNTLVNILLQNVASSMFGRSASWSLKVGVPLVITLLFGEIIPKYLGIQNNVSITKLVASQIALMQNLLKPLRKFIIAITVPISRMVFFFLREEERISIEELEHVLQQSKEHGVLNPEEADLISGFLNFQESTVRELMRPRGEILFYDIGEPLSKLIYLMVDQQCTRIPVFQHTVDDLLGIITAKDFFLKRDQIVEPKDLIPFLSPPFYVPETTSAPQLLKQFNENNEEIAIVVDEYSSLAGLITFEDIVEVVVGQISDLRDEKNLYTVAGEQEIIASGKLELEHFNKIFHSNLKSPNNMVTIGGWLTEKMGEIPKSGTKYEYEGMLFQILAAEPNRIRRVYIHRLEERKK